MARELQFINSAYTGETLYVLLFNSTGSVRDVVAGAWDSWADADIDDYDIVLTEQGSSGYFNGDMPSVAAGVYSFTVRQQAGASPAVTDTDLGSGKIVWDGNAEVDFATMMLSELSSVPGASAKPSEMLGWLYLLARNKITQTSGEQSVKADDGSTEVGSATVSDDGTTFTRNEFS